MRRLAAVAVLLAVVTARPAAAAAMNFYDQCLLVPYAAYRGDGQSTAVGLSARDDGTVHWQFRSVDGDATSGAFAVGRDTLTSFIWSEATVGRRFAAVAGSLLFCADRNGDREIDSDDGDILAGNAFLIDLGADDVAFLPTINVDDDDLESTRVDEFPSGRNLVARLRETALSDDFLDLQFLVDGRSNAGVETRIVVWTSAGLAGSRQRMTAFDAAGGREEFDLRLPGANLHVFDPDTIPAVTGLLTDDGFIRWRIPEAGGETVYVFAFSVVSSPDFGATQTVLGNY